MHTREEIIEEVSRLYEQGRLNEAIDIITGYLKCADHDMEIMSDYGVLLYSAGKPNEAEVIFYDLIKKEPYHVEALMNLAHAHHKKQEYNSAIDKLKAVPDWKNKPEVLVQLTNIYYDMGLFFSAYTMYQGACNTGADTAFQTSHTYLRKYSSLPTVTFYVPCYNASEYIVDCLKSILAQTYPVAQLLVIDDGSTDNSIELASRFDRVKIIRHEKNKGLAAARNTAFKNATHQLVASIDSDVAVSPDWLERVVLNLEGDMVAGVGGKLLEEKTSRLPDRWRQVYMDQHFGDTRQINPPSLYGSNTIFIKSAVETVGFYKEEGYRTNGEDTYISRQLNNAGFNLVYEPNAICRHMRTDSISSVLNTAWGWGMPGFKSNGYYSTWKGIQEKIKESAKITLAKFNTDTCYKRFHLYYIDLMELINSIMKDFRFFFELEPEKECKLIAGQTFMAVKAILRFCLRCNEIPVQLSDIAMKHLLSIKLGDACFDEQSDNEEKLEDIFPLENYKATSGLGDSITKKLPKANVKTALMVAQRVLNIIGCLPDNVINATRVSALRAENEDIKEDQTKVVITNPPWKKDGRHGVRAGSRWPFTSSVCDDGRVGYMPYPFFMGYTASLLMQNGICTQLVDAIAEELTQEEFSERIRGIAPEMVVIETSTPSISEDLRYARILKLDSPKMQVVLVGPHATIFSEKLLRENFFVDVIVRGEYEHAVLDLAQAGMEKKNWHDIKGLAFRHDDGHIQVNADREHVKDFNLPWPERKTLPMFNYNDAFAGLAVPNVQVWASRGCPYNCIFCVWPQVVYGNNRYRTRDVQDLVDEMEWLVSHYGFKAVYFDDDTFNIGKERLLSFCEELKARNINIPWGVMARADASDFETLKAMKEAGLYAIKFGVESAVQQIVNDCGKRLDLGKVPQSVKWCRQLGIKTHLTFTFGLPGETIETAQQSIAWAVELDPDSVQFSITTPFPGTAYFDCLDKKGLIKNRNWDDYDGAKTSVMVSETLSSQQLEWLLNKANETWYLHKCRPC